MIEFTPSQVRLDGFPFIGTFDRIETELTAAVIVQALALNGDTWRVIDCIQLSQVFTELTAVEGKWRQLFDNPFVTIDMHGLVKRGYAQWHKDGKAIEFTEAGRLKMVKWLKSSEEVASET